MDWSNKIFVGYHVDDFLNWMEDNFYEWDRGLQCYLKLRKDIRVEVDKEFKDIIKYYDLKCFLLEHYAYNQFEKEADNLTCTHIPLVQSIEVEEGKKDDSLISTEVRNMKDEILELQRMFKVKDEIEQVMLKEISELRRLFEIKDSTEQDMRKEIKELKQQLMEKKGIFNETQDLKHKELQNVHNLDNLKEEFNLNFKNINKEIGLVKEHEIILNDRIERLIHDNHDEISRLKVEMNNLKHFVDGALEKQKETEVKMLDSEQILLSKLETLKNIININEKEITFERQVGVIQMESRENMACYFCKKIGHKKRFCTKYLQWKDHINCYNCGEFGHIARACMYNNVDYGADYERNW